MTQIDLQQFQAVFLEEAGEHLHNFEQLLLGLDLAQPDAEALNSIFRAAHSLKGSSGIFGFQQMTNVTHVLESLLDRARAGTLSLTTEMVDAFLDVRDLLEALRSQYQGGPAVPEETITSQVLRLQTFLDTAPVVAGSAPAAQEAEDGSFGFFEPLPNATSSADDDSFGFFEPLPEAAAAGSDPAPAPAPAPVAAAPTAVPDAGGLIDRRRPENDRRQPALDSNSIRVGVNKVDQLINLAGELVITQAMVAQTAAGLDPGAFEHLHRAIEQLERNTRDLQEVVMSIRMLPMQFVFSRFPRLVRDLSGKLGKQIELVMSGEHTELDKGLIEQLVDPLTHLVRNSIDHGIEMPEERRAVGKPASGLISLSAYHKGGSIIVEISDDGRGLSREKILAKARSQGLAASDELSDAEVWQFIFTPGFSTAAAVTDISGRGVGMDVVKRNIAAMGGRIELDSSAGQGTRISIRLPLTLAILDGMSVALGEQAYIIPLVNIIESLQPAAEDIKTITANERVLRLRDDYLPLIALHDLLNTPPRVPDPTRGIVVILEVEERRYALQVDELLGQHQVVIKSLEANFRKVPGIAGATIMGDGHVALILDAAALFQLSQERPAA